MSDFKIVVPEATTNYCLNPSGEIAGNFAAAGGSTVTRVTTYQKYGVYSYRVQTAGNNEGVEFTLGTLTNAIHYVTVRVAGTLPTTWDWSLDDATYNEPTLIEDIDGTWSLYGFEFPAAQANASTTLYIDQNGAGTGDFYLDGIQVEQKDDYYTTFCDGSQDGCEWNGAHNASTSTRSALSRAGGRIRDLQDDYSFQVEAALGTGVGPLDLGVDEYALLPGGELNSIKEKYRVFTLTGTFLGTSTTNYHALRQALINVISKDAVPQDDRGYQPVRIRYTGAAVQKEIACHYDDGLKVDIQGNQPISCSEQIPLSFLADNPYWYEIGNSAVVLDPYDTPTTRGVLRRTPTAWDVMGPPNAAGTYTAIYAIIEDNSYVYIAGNFLNYDNIANADYIVRYNKDTGAYSAMSTGANGIVYDLAKDSRGYIWAVGAFTNIGGVACNRISYWDGAAWNAWGAGADNDIYGITISIPSGSSTGQYIYIVGNFANAGGGAAAYVAQTSTSSNTYAALAGGLSATGYGVGVDSNFNVYAIDTTGGGGDGLVVWNGAAWTVLDGDAVSDLGNPLLIDDDDSVVYHGTSTRILRYNGTQVVTVCTMGNTGNFGNIKKAPDGTIYTMTDGGRGLNNGLAQIFPESGTYLVIDGNTNYNQRGFLISPRKDNNYTIYVVGGFNGGAGSPKLAAVTNATNNGTAMSYPQIYCYQTGGIYPGIYSMRNDTRGVRLGFVYNANTIANGETVVIDTEPKTQTITSDIFGNRQDILSPISNFGDFGLIPGVNIINTFWSSNPADAGVTITTWMQWRAAYTSWD